MKTDLDRKRDHLARLISEKNKARQSLLSGDVTLDYDPSAFERHSDFKRVLYDLRNCDEATLDMLIEYHAPDARAPRCVW